MAMYDRYVELQGEKFAKFMWSLLLYLHTPVLWSVLLLPVNLVAILIWSGQLSTGSAVADRIVLIVWAVSAVIDGVYFSVEKAVKVQPGMLHVLWKNSKWKMCSLIASRFALDLTQLEKHNFV